jgi:hypothetical protein
VSRFVTSTPLSNMRPVGSPAERTLPRLQAVLDREFPEGIGLTLAEPVHRRDGAGVDWYVDGDEPMTPMTDLPQETAQIYRARLRAIVANVLHFAASQEARNDATGRSTASTLRNAVTFPGDAHVWIAGDAAGGRGRIVLTAWGHEGHDSLSARRDITATGRIPETGAAAATAAAGTAAAATEPEAPAVVPVVAARSRWWWHALAALLMLIPLILAAWIAWILLPACGTHLPFGKTVFGWGQGMFCAEAHPELDAADRRAQALLSEAALLKDQVRRHARECVPPPPPPPPPDPGAAMDRALDEAGVDNDPNMVTLLWHNHADLDLHLICPDGDEVYFHQQSACNAQLNVDRNAGDSVDDPIENITWGDRSLPPGHYKVRVKLFDRKDVTDPTIGYTIRLKRRGQPDQTIDREIGRNKEDQQVVEFDVP